MYTAQVVDGKFEIRDGSTVVIVPAALDDEFEAHVRRCLPPSRLLTDSAREQCVHDACADWLTSHT